MKLFDKFTDFVLLSPSKSMLSLPHEFHHYMAIISYESAKELLMF